MHDHVHDHVHDHDHDHDHAHPHGHAHGHGGSSRKLLLALLLTTAMMVVEVVGSVWSGSLALLADAGHMLVDTLALLLAFVSAWLATKPADDRRSYGYARLEVLAGFVNALTQFVLVGFIVWEAVNRLMRLEEVHILSGVMLWVAAVGLLVNLFVLRSLHGHAHDDMNVGAAALHVMGDLLGSVAAVAAALLIGWLGWTWTDPVLSLLVSLLILASAWRLLRRSSHILLEGVPEGLDPAEMEATLGQADGAIRGVHHLHVWQLASGSRMATLHAELHDQRAAARALDAIKHLLRQRYDIRHATVQIDPERCPDEHGGCTGHERH